MTVNWTTGNAREDTTQTRGWLVGHFLDPGCGVRATGDVEVKWGTHPAGESRAQWTEGETRTTLVVLVEGHFVVELDAEAVLLERPGDYAMWGPGIEHRWRAPADTTVMTVRWPSTAL